MQKSKNIPFQTIWFLPCAYRIKAMKKVTIKRIEAQVGVEDAENLLLNQEKPKHLFESSFITLKEGGFIVLDFGKELRGRLHICYVRNPEGKIRVRLGESLAETSSTLGEKGACNDHSLRDYVYPVIMLSDFSTTESGFRYARIDAVSGGPVYIGKIYAEEADNGLTVLSSFACSDKRLNAIYQTAARTIDLCVGEDEIWDGIKRDRAVWLGDFYPEMVSALSLYGPIPQIKHVLKMIEDFPDSYANHFPAYSAWWLLCLCAYYSYTGDRAFFLDNLSDIDKTVSSFGAIIGEDGEAHFERSPLSFYENQEYFIDWPTHETSDAKIGWHYLLTYALSTLEKTKEELGISAEQEKSIVARLDRFSYGPSSFKQVNALGVLSKRLDAKTGIDVIKKGGAKGLSTFTSFLCFEALKENGEGKAALEIMKEYYGAMLDLGATSFFEDFDMDWLKDDPLPIVSFEEKGKKHIHADYGKFCYKGFRHSLCHGWSSGFIPFFYEHILGIERMEPGYAAIRINPHLYCLSEASGRLMTPKGLIKVSHKSINGQIKSEIGLPKGVNLIK